MNDSSGATRPVVYTIGHSTRPVSALIELLAAYEIRNVADIRTIPRSRHNPQFDQDALRSRLRAAGIAYIHMKGLGGLRHTRRESPNAGWKNEGFRGFADHMQSREFEESLASFLEVARLVPTALLCAEAVPWRCHRSLIADALSVRGILVRHILGASSCRDHELTTFARVRGIHLTYPLPTPARPEELID